jgi:hypothetical protein
MRLRAGIVLLLSIVLVVELPLLGLALVGQPLAAYLDFPPRTEQVEHAPFAWRAFVLVALPILAVIALYIRALHGARPGTASPAVESFPWWGWLGFALIIAAWFLAWSRGIVPPGWQRHTFTPLWLGYILVMNALTLRRTGEAPLTRQPGLFLLLFPVSGTFWWLFEYLNQFVDNWYYSGVQASTGWDYFLQDTLPFTTVLLAVLSTWAWLKSFPRLDTMRLSPVQPPAWFAWPALALGAFGLIGIGLCPDKFYFMLWTAPLLLLLGFQQVLMGETLLTPLTRGDWRPLLQPPLAALYCGFFWEMWNWGSLARWHYNIPYVERFHLFEMPLLGYAGYLPFGVECAVVIDLVARMKGRRPLCSLSRV